MNKVLKTIAVIELIGGLIGVVYVALLGRSLLDVAGGAVSLAVFATVSLVSLAVGVLLLRAKRWGLLLSRFVQLVQVPVISLTPILYHLGLGIFLALGSYTIAPETGKLSFSVFFQWGLGADYVLALASQLPEQYIAANAFALLMLIGLFHNVPAGPLSVREAAA